MEDEKVVIIGGGIIGCATAYMLKKLSPGSRVLVLERSNDIGHESSYQNGGSLSYGFNKAWNGRSILWKALKSYNDPFSYYKINPALFFNFDFWLWAFRFFWASYSGLSDRSDQVFALGKRTYELHTLFRKDLIAKQGNSFDEYLGVDTGLVLVFSTVSDFQKAKSHALSDNINHSQNNHILSSRSGCHKYEPSIQDWKQEVVGCIKNHSELFCGHDSNKLTKGLAQVAKSNGVVFEYNSEVESFEIKNNKIASIKLSDGRVIIGDKFVICSGVGSRALGEMLGWVPPIWPGKGYSCNMKFSKTLKHSLYITGDLPYYIVPMKDFNRVSGFCEFTTMDDKFVNEVRLNFLVETIKKNTGIPDADVSNVWACQRPITIDDLPIIGKFPGIENAYINSGHGSKGSIFSLGSAELISHILMNTSPIMDPKPFSPSRFYF